MSHQGVLKDPAEQRVLLPNTSWEAYELLLKEREERRSPRFFYDRGVLEILSPSAEHESVSRIVAQLVGLLAAGMGFGSFAVGSTTFKRRDLNRGFEPDECFYLGAKAAQARELVAGKGAIDLDEGDPAPDLVFEADITSPSLDKLPAYARLGVGEVWRYVGGDGRTEILVLAGEPAGGYETAEQSAVVPGLAGEALARLIRRGLATDPSEWVPEVLEWARRNRPSR